MPNFKRIFGYNELTNKKTKGHILWICQNSPANNRLK